METGGFRLSKSLNEGSFGFVLEGFMGIENALRLFFKTGYIWDHLGDRVGQDSPSLSLLALGNRLSA